MIRYVIRACPQRMWYVNEFLVPSMLAQGISESVIDVHNDSEGLGNLESCMRSFRDTKGSKDDFTWFLQDDVIICGDFKERTEVEYDTFVGAFVSKRIDKGELHFGRTSVANMWYSFPCIGMPNWLANNCAKWYYEYASRTTEYRVYISSKRMDDTLFWIFMQDFSNVSEIINLAPNLVDHVDYLIGGSVTNKERDKSIVIRSSYFEYPELVQKLEETLNGNK